MGRGEGKFFKGKYIVLYMDIPNIAIIAISSAIFSLIFSILMALLVNFLRDYSVNMRLEKMEADYKRLYSQYAQARSADVRQGNKERMGEAVAAATEAYGKIMKESPDLDKRQVMLKVIAEVGMQYPDVALQLGKQMLSGKNPLKGLGL